MEYSEFYKYMYGIELLDKIPKQYFDYNCNQDTKDWHSTFYIMNDNDVSFFEVRLGLGHFLTFNFNIKENNIQLQNDTGYVYKKYENIKEMEQDLIKHSFDYRSLTNQ